MPPAYVQNVRKMRIVFAIAGLAVMFAIICIVLAIVLGAQVNPPQAASNGLVLVTTNLSNSSNPMRSGNFIFSPDRSKMLLLTDNLYVIDLSLQSQTKQAKSILWSAASNNNCNCDLFLTLSGNATLQVQALDSNNQTIEIWSNNISLPNDNYFLQISNEGIVQIVNASKLQVVWSNS
jgi:hypothetical protein